MVQEVMDLDEDGLIELNVVKLVESIRFAGEGKAFGDRNMGTAVALNNEGSRSWAIVRTQ